jgi:cytochrome oxidase Cu insertion factor (SCO1/SenC/PrrC family)
VRARAALLVGALLSAAAVCGAGQPADDASRRLPAPGSYELPPIARVSDFSLLDSTGAQAPLLGLAPGQVALVSLVYTTCPSACPAALAVMQGVDRDVAAEPSLRNRVRLVTVSFDPEKDRPEQMAALQQRMEPQSDWRFLTAADEADIEPVLASFDQDTLRLRMAAEEPEAPDQETPLIRHVLKVFLVDDAGDVRNIYSAGLFSRELVVADMRTVLMEEASGSAALSTNAAQPEEPTRSER